MDDFESIKRRKLSPAVEPSSDDTVITVGKATNNSIANILTKEQIDELVELWFCRCYVQGQGKPRANALSYAVAFIVKDESGEYWANPFAFSATKDFFCGYPTYPYKLTPAQSSILAPKSTTKKSTWIPRIPVHCVLWRWYNNYVPIPSGLDVSHLRHDSFCISMTNLAVESGVINRSRCACDEGKWFEKLKGCGCESCIRCPHDPRCLPRVVRPSLDTFRNARAAIGQLPDRRPVLVNI